MLGSDRSAIAVQPDGKIVLGAGREPEVPLDGLTLARYAERAEGERRRRQRSQIRSETASSL